MARLCNDAVIWARLCNDLLDSAYLPQDGRICWREEQQTAEKGSGWQAHIAGHRELDMEQYRKYQGLLREFGWNTQLTEPQKRMVEETGELPAELKTLMSEALSEEQLISQHVLS